ncbi:Zn(2)-C7 fungal-type transcription factor [Pseudohyphozyma bogoriensis]|nr:Zn(2)-C7 fungal-type transcription factor [Pseudohyphozyma bogoriensis]
MDYSHFPAGFIPSPDPAAQMYHPQQFDISTAGFPPAGLQQQAPLEDPYWFLNPPVAGPSNPAPPAQPTPPAPAAPPGERMKSCAACRIALFGGENADSTGLTSGQKRQRVEDTLAIGFRNDSVVAKLVTTELEGALSSSLLDLYFLLPQPRLALLEATSFRQAFEAAGRRMSDMDPGNQVLFSVILAVAARVSDHPLLIGSSAPTLKQLDQATRLGDDLSEWGQRREEACAALADKALKLADANAVWREASATNIATLLLLEGMKDFTEEAPMGQLTKRPFSDAYMSHVRELIETDPDGSVRDQIMVREATIAAHSGRPPTFHDDEFDMLIRDEPLESLQDALKSPELDPTNMINGRSLPFHRLFFSFMIHLSSIARACPANLTGFKARKRPFDLEFGYKMMADIDLASEALPALEKRAMYFLGPFETCGQAQKAMWSYVRLLEVNRSTMCLLLNRCVKERLDAHTLDAAPRFQEVDSQDGSSPQEDSYWKRMSDFYLLTRMRAVQGARQIIQMIELNVSLGIMSGASLLLARLPFWLRLIIEQPTVEEGGQLEGFTYDSKIKDLRTVLYAVYKIGWSFAKYSKPAESILREIEVLEHRQRIHKLSQANTNLSGLNTLSPSADSNSSGSASTTSAAASPPGLSDADINKMIEEMTVGMPPGLFPSGSEGMALDPTQEFDPAAFGLDASTFDMASLVTSAGTVGTEDSAVVDMLDQSRHILIDFTEFRLAFERTGRRIRAMDPQLQVLAHVILALSARSSFLEHIADLARKTSKRLTGMFARRKPYIDEEFCRYFIGECLTAHEAIPALVQRGIAFALLQVTFSRDCLSTIRNFRCMWVEQCFLIDSIVGQRLATKFSPESVGPKAPKMGCPKSDDELYWHRLRVMKERTTYLSYLAVRELAHISRIVFRSVKQWLPTFLDTPAAEEGGPADFDFATKVEELGWLHKSICSIGWNYPSLAQSEEWIRAELEKLKTREMAYMASLPVLPALDVAVVSEETRIESLTNAIFSEALEETCLVGSKSNTNLAVPMHETVGSGLEGSGICPQVTLKVCV